MKVERRGRPRKHPPSKDEIMRKTRKAVRKEILEGVTANPIDLRDNKNPDIEVVAGLKRRDAQAFMKMLTRRRAYYHRVLTQEARFRRLQQGQRWRSWVEHQS